MGFDGDGGGGGGGVGLRVSIAGISMKPNSEIAKKILFTILLH